MTPSSSTKNITLSISDTFDGGNAKFIKQQVNTTDEKNIVEVYIHIKPDIFTELEDISHMQYFAFRVTLGGLNEKADETQQVKYIIDNAYDVSYPEAWSGTTVFYSRDVEDVDSWIRNRSTAYTDGKLHWTHTHTHNGPLFFAYFPPYSYARHMKLISNCTSAASEDNHAIVMTLGQSLEGREMECIQCGIGPLKCWIIHRQHPGETMAEHYAEGLLNRLLGIENNGKIDIDDKIVQRVLQTYTFYIIPCMCPDGAVLGHLRTNACGANLNREWATVNDNYIAPSLERSPEVYHVLNKMDETGVDISLDIHGDEELPFNFLSGATYVPKWGPRMQALHGAFLAAYCRANSSMQKKIGYPPPESPEKVLNYMHVATNQIANRFDCLAVTLEMPFKDCLSNPDPERGWNPSRSRKLGASVLEPLLYIAPYLRAEGMFWKEFGPDEQYINTTDEYDPTMISEEGDEGFKMLKKRFYSDVHEGRKHRPAAFQQQQQQQQG